MSSFCFTETKETVELAQKIVALGNKQYKSSMSVLSALFPYIVDEYKVRHNVRDVDNNTVQDDITNNWSEWEDFLRSYIKSYNSFNELAFNKVRTAIINRLQNPIPYNRFLKIMV